MAGQVQALRRRPAIMRARSARPGRAGQEEQRRLGPGRGVDMVMCLKDQAARVRPRYRPVERLRVSRPGWAGPTGCPARPGRLRGSARGRSCARILACSSASSMGFRCLGPELRPRRRPSGEDENSTREASAAVHGMPAVSSGSSAPRSSASEGAELVGKALLAEAVHVQVAIHQPRHLCRPCCGRPPAGLRSHSSGRRHRRQ